MLVKSQANMGASGSQTDFQSVMSHEIGHTLGFYSTVSSDGFWSIGSDGVYQKSFFDQLMSHSDGSPIDNHVSLGESLNVGDDGLTVFNPPSWAQGSSMSHIDASSDPDALMQWNIGEGVVRRSPSDSEIALMKDMGWNFVPESSSACLFLLSALVPCLCRRRGGELRLRMGRHKRLFFLFFPSFLSYVQVRFRSAGSAFGGLLNKMEGLSALPPKNRDNLQLLTVCGF